jgi:hypothetical protein
MVNKTLARKSISATRASTSPKLKIKLLYNLRYDGTPSAFNAWTFYITVSTVRN